MFISFGPLALICLLLNKPEQTGHSVNGALGASSLPCPLMSICAKKVLFVGPCLCQDWGDLFSGVVLCSIIDWRGH